ncbi:MAG: 2'-5' RNA ligase family protein [Dehalococcoidales bacterium]|nr:2'-5' RNA ligase family protein [Dehalococcoidales bacterium]
MAKKDRTYAIVLTFSEDIENVLSKMRRDFQRYIDHFIVPHITLVYPFTPVFSMYQIYDELGKVAKRTSPFDITLKGIKYFDNGNNVAYAAIKNRQPVKKLHTDIVKSLDGYIKETETDGKFNLDNYIPHVTIGSHIPDKVFKNIKLRFSKYKLYFEDEITFINLFVENKGVWERTRVFEMAG